jgi:hypothetical protein
MANTGTEKKDTELFKIVLLFKKLPFAIKLSTSFINVITFVEKS